MFNEDFLVEYYGVTPSDYPFPTIIENIIYLPHDINIKNILRVYTSLDVIFTNKDELFSGVDCSGCTYSNGILFFICNISFNIEYIDTNKNDTISIFSDYIYCPLTLPIENNTLLNSFSPKISHTYVKLLDSSNIYIYLTICPY